MGHISFILHDSEAPFYKDFILRRTCMAKLNPPKAINKYSLFSECCSFIIYRDLAFVVATVVLLLLESRSISAVEDRLRFIGRTSYHLKAPRRTHGLGFL